MSLALPENLTDTVITVRHLADRDAAAFAAGTTDAAVRRFAHLPTPHYTAETVREQIRGVIADGLRDGNLAVLAPSPTRPTTASSARSPSSTSTAPQPKSASG
ncbi:hypothetical protein AB0I53_43240 [Saccharopolyspora sp. NPDC050389]|uniref:hypothetical protein n=1 Tax=Saccharopolyspora sp. NPDC050389 TaxID=3155516 RepID=UPI0033DCD7EF